MKRTITAVILTIASLISTSVSADGERPDKSRIVPALNKAFDVLIAASRDDDPFIRANAIESLQMIPGRVAPIVHRGLSDPEPVVRYAATVTIGALRIQGLAPNVAQLRKDPSPSVRAASLYALKSLGHNVNISPLGQFLVRSDPNLRGNVAMLLTLLGNRSALPMLQTVAGTPMPRVSAERIAVVRAQIAEAMARLGDQRAFESLRSGMYSQFPEVRVIAVTALGGLGDRKMERAMMNIVQDPSFEELQVAAAVALARIGNYMGETLCVQFTHEDHSSVLRAEAAWALGWFMYEKSFDRVEQLLSDPQTQVRVFAAASIIRRALAAKQRGDLTTDKDTNVANQNRRSFAPFPSRSR